MYNKLNKHKNTILILAIILTTSLIIIINPLKPHLRCCINNFGSKFNLPPKQLLFTEQLPLIEDGRLEASKMLLKKIYSKNNLPINDSYSNQTFNPKSKKIIYLTFDDGPTPVVTGQLLDVLNNYNIKATFFVVGKEIEGREKILKRIYDEGHAIGLHTYSHNEKKIYSNPQIFIDEMLKTRDKIKDVTGCECNIIRFPWGSYNQYFHLNKSMLDTLHNQNFKIYDWNCNLEDGIYPNLSTNNLVRNSKKYKDDYPDIIVLMHCNFNNKNTVKALPEIIEYYKNLEYEFKKITEETPEYYYKFKN